MFKSYFFYQAHQVVLLPKLVFILLLQIFFEEILIDCVTNIIKILKEAFIYKYTSAWQCIKQL